MTNKNIELSHKEEVSKEKNKKKAKNISSRKDKAFYYTFIAWPVIQFLIFYVGVNFNSFLLSFESYDVNTSKYYFPSDILVNFKRVFKNFTELDRFKSYFLNSFFAFISHILFGISIGVLIAYFIYKKARGSKFYKVMVMMPSFISSLIFVAIFTILVDSGIPMLYKQLTGETMAGLITNSKTSFWVIMAYGLWFGTGGSMLLYLNAMDQIPDTLIDAAKIDGCSYLEELIHIILPQIWQTFVVFFSVSIASYFTNIMGIYAFWGKNADSSISTFGYYYYVSVLCAGKADYPYFSAIGLLCTSIAVPVTLIVRNLMIKKGPSNE